MRILVTGTRNRPTVGQIHNLVDAMRSLPPSSVVVEGGANGVDAIAYAVAIALGLEVETFEADWEVLDKAAGPIRNQQMVDSGADECWAFPSSSSRGTWDCVHRAESADIRVSAYME